MINRQEQLANAVTNLIAETQQTRALALGLLELIKLFHEYGPAVEELKRRENDKKGSSEEGISTGSTQGDKGSTDSGLELE